MSLAIKPRIDFLTRIKKYNKRYTTLLLKTLRINSKIYNYKNYQFFLKMFKTLRFRTQRNFCILTGNSRGVVRKYKMVRHEFKRLANDGLLSGITKASF